MTNDEVRFLVKHIINFDDMNTIKENYIYNGYIFLETTSKNIEHIKDCINTLNSFYKNKKIHVNLLNVFIENFIYVKDLNYEKVELIPMKNKKVFSILNNKYGVHINNKSMRDNLISAEFNKDKQIFKLNYNEFTLYQGVNSYKEG